MSDILTVRQPLEYGPKGGRWNGNNAPLINCSNTRSLALFGIYCIMGRQAAKGGFVMAELNLEGDIRILVKNDLPADWRNLTHSRATKEFGTNWTIMRVSLGIKVPSARMPLSCLPDEHNLLINPFHPDFLKSIALVGTEILRLEINDAK